LKPDWGKLNVRNFREGAGNVTMGAGLRPTAKAVETPPDPTVGAPALYPAIGRMGASGRAVTRVNARVASKNDSGGRALILRAKAAGVVAGWLTRRVPSGGV
jgi:hypothetical protein